MADANSYFANYPEQDTHDMPTINFMHTVREALVAFIGFYFEQVSVRYGHLYF